MAKDVHSPLGSRAGVMKTVKDWLKVSLVAGGSAGNFTLTGIAVGDELVSVLIVPANGAIVNVTSEFSITAANTINNTGGTASTSNQLLVIWADLTRS